MAAGGRVAFRRDHTPVTPRFRGSVTACDGHSAISTSPWRLTAPSPPAAPAPAAAAAAAIVATAPDAHAWPPWMLINGQARPVSHVNWWSGEQTLSNSQDQDCRLPPTHLSCDSHSAPPPAPLLVCSNYRYQPHTCDACIVTRYHHRKTVWRGPKVRGQTGHVRMMCQLYVEGHISRDFEWGLVPVKAEQWTGDTISMLRAQIGNYTKGQNVARLSTLHQVGTRDVW